MSRSYYDYVNLQYVGLTDTNRRIYLAPWVGRQGGSGHGHRDRDLRSGGEWLGLMPILWARAVDAGNLLIVGREVPTRLDIPDYNWDMQRRTIGTAYYEGVLVGLPGEISPEEPSPVIGLQPVDVPTPVPVDAGVEIAIAVGLLIAVVFIASEI